MKKFAFRFFAALLLLLLPISQSALLLGQDRGPERRDASAGRQRGGPGGPGGPGGSRGPEGRPPWMQGGGGPGGGGPGGQARPGGPGGPQGGADRNERMLGMLRSMDTNRNGRLESGEIPEYRREFVHNVVRQMGGDPTKTIDLNTLGNQSAARRNQPQQEATGTPSAANLPKEPLVPYFGETAPEETPVLEFGQKSPETQPAKAAAAVAATANQQEQILRTAREIMNRYDKTKSGTLDKDKGEWVASLPFNAVAADKNKDGRISMAELIESLGGKKSASTGAAAVSTKPSAAYDRLPQGVPEWFFERDKNQDGQLTMMEYANGQTWTEAIADEFRFLDKNNDGVATIDEIFVTLKQVDEEKRLKEEQAKRELERRKGVGSTPAPPAGEPNQDGRPAPPANPDGSPAPPGGAGGSPPPRDGAAPPQPVAIQPAPTAQAEPSGQGWRPGSSGAAPTSAPSTAPYSSGTGDANRGSYNRSDRGGQRPSGGNNQRPSGGGRRR